MLVVIILGLLAMFFAWNESTNKLKYGLGFSFGLIFLFLALRYNFGNDYMSYLGGFREVNKYSTINYFDHTYRVEPGWIFLCRIFKPVGFFGMIAVLALFNCVVYYRFIKKYVPKKYYWFAVFLYIFTPGFMLVQASSMRQSLAVVLFIFSLDYLYKKDVIRYILCVGAASLIHTSALILIPVFLLGFSNWKFYKITAFIIISIAVSLFLFGEYFLPNITEFIDRYFERYEIYQTGGILKTGLGVFYYFTLFLITIYFMSFQNEQTSLIFKIASLSFIFIPLSLLIQMMGRLGMYFEPAIIVVYPIILMNYKKPVFKTIFIALLLFMTTYQFYQFFYSSSSVYKDYFRTYQTIFSSRIFY